MLCATVSDNSTIGLDLGFRSQGLTADCRICLEEGNDFSETGLIAPCYCAGSVRYVHFRCLSDWILRTKKDSIGESGKKITFECEMCKHFIYYEQRVQRSCKSVTQVREEIVKNLCTFIFHLLIEIVSFTFIAVLIGVVMVKIQFSSENLFELLILGAALLLPLVVSIINLYSMLKDYFLNSNPKITKIYEQETMFRRRSSLNKSQQYSLAVFNTFNPTEGAIQDLE